MNQARPLPPSSRWQALLARLGLAYLLALGLILGGLAAGAQAHERHLAAQLAVLCLTHPELDAPGDNGAAADRHLDCFAHCSAGVAGLAVLPAPDTVRDGLRVVFRAVLPPSRADAPTFRLAGLPPPQTGPPLLT